VSVSVFVRRYIHVARALPGIPKQAAIAPNNSESARNPLSYATERKPERPPQNAARPTTIDFLMVRPCANLTTFNTNTETGIELSRAKINPNTVPMIGKRNVPKIAPETAVPAIELIAARINTPRGTEFDGVSTI
jgi:hypothetical protein